MAAGLQAYAHRSCWQSNKTEEAKEVKADEYVEDLLKGKHLRDRKRDC